MIDPKYNTVIRINLLKMKAFILFQLELSQHNLYYLSPLQNPFPLHLFSETSSSNPQIFHILFTCFFIFKSVHGRLKPLLCGFPISLSKKIFRINEFCNGLKLFFVLQQNIKRAAKIKQSFDTYCILKKN